MVHHCAAINCKNRDGKEVRANGLTFHKFPFSRPNMLQRWIANVRREEPNGQPWQPTMATRLCSVHFTAESFDRTGQTVRLKSEAVPTLFQFPDHQLKNCTPRKTKTAKKAALPNQTKSPEMPSTSCANVVSAEQSNITQHSPRKSKTGNQFEEICKQSKQEKTKKQQLQKKVVVIGWLNTMKRAVGTAGDSEGEEEGERKQKRPRVTTEPAGDAEASLSTVHDGNYLQRHTAAPEEGTHCDAGVDRNKPSSLLDTEGKWRQEASVMGPVLSQYNESDFEMRLRKDPTLMAMEVTQLKAEPSVMDVDMKGETSNVAGLAMEVSEEPSSMKQYDTLRRGETVVMSEDRNSYKERSVLGMEMSTLNSFMSLRSESSVMDTNVEMSSVPQKTVSDVGMVIKQEPEEAESDVSRMKETPTLETAMSIKTEPSFFGAAFDSDDNMPPVCHEMRSEDTITQMSAPYIKVEPGSSFVENYADCVDTPVPLLRARYTVTSGSSHQVATSSAFKEKLVVKLKNRAVSKYKPFSRKGKRRLAKSKQEVESIPACSDDTGIVIKCEPTSDSDEDHTTSDERVQSEMKMTKTRRQGANRKNSPACSHCQQCFCSSSSLKRHHKRKHSMETLSFSCSLCDAKFARMPQLRAHERLHRGGDKTFPCQECDVVFTRACHLKVHMRKHTGERPYTCSVTDCTATFRSTSNLNRHLMKHSGLRPYICTVCGANFYQSSHLVSHVRKHTGERPFKCTQCDATFTQLTHLHRHRVKHTGEKPFKCSTCGMGFVEKCALRRHMVVHNKQLQSGSVSRLKRNKRTAASSSEASVQQSSSELS
ncbi:uncharacterized protein LOC143285795 [Babylonia areolata]|uniref:uncharacterized protein LOC143285795 n=1 Tax=Babylonia areolata TaxID=304850 RepID=UPI003FD58585